MPAKRSNTLKAKVACHRGGQRQVRELDGALARPRSIGGCGGLYEFGLVSAEELFQRDAVPAAPNRSCQAPTV
jgi:hypothetical protein